MTDTTISDAICAPQDDGTGVSDGSEDFTSAGYFMLLAKYKGDGSYVGEDNTGSATLQFNDVDTTNEEVDVGTGYAYIHESSHTVQSGAQTTYDTTLPVSTPYVVILPTEVTNLGLGTDTSNDLWLAVDPTTNDDVYIRHGSGLSAPTDPSVKLGTVDTSSGDTTRANDLSDDTHDTVTVNTKLDAPAQDPSDVSGSRSFGSSYTNSNDTWRWVSVVANADASPTDLRLNLQVSGTNVDRNDQRDATSGNKVSVEALVPSGNSYQVDKFGDTSNISLSQWTEWQLGE